MLNFKIFKDGTTELISKKLKIKIAFIIAFINEIINKLNKRENELIFEYYDIGNISFKIGISIKKAKEIFNELILIEFFKKIDENLFLLLYKFENKDENQAQEHITKEQKLEKRKAQLRNAQSKFRAKKNNQNVNNDNHFCKHKNNQNVNNNNQKPSSLSSPLSFSLSPITPISEPISSSLPSSPPITAPKEEDFLHDYAEKNEKLDKENPEKQKKQQENGKLKEKNNKNTENLTLSDLKKEEENDFSDLSDNLGKNENFEDLKEKEEKKQEKKEQEIDQKSSKKEKSYPIEFEKLWQNASENIYKKLNRDCGNKKRAARKWKEILKNKYENTDIQNAIFACSMAIKMVEKKEYIWFSVKEFDGFLNSNDNADKKRWLYWLEKYKEAERIKQNFLNRNIKKSDPSFEDKIN